MGTPQIRNRGTVAGNLVTASPANDTIVPLVAMGARVALESPARGRRELPVSELMLGVRRTALEPDEMVTEISFPALKDHEAGAFIKLGPRRANAISVVSTALVVGFRSASRRSGIERASITLGPVAPAIVTADEAQDFLVGKTLDDGVIAEAARLGARAAPIDDIRGTARHRVAMVEVLVARGLTSLRDATERDQFPAEPVMPWGRSRENVRPRDPEPAAPTDVIETTVNGKRLGSFQSMLRPVT